MNNSYKIYASQDYVDEKISEIEVPVQSVNGKTGEIVLTPSDVGAQPVGNYLTEESDPTVPSWAKEENKPTYTANEIEAGTFAGQVAANTSAQTPGNYLLRNSKLVSAESTPTVNGEICWLYE